MKERDRETETERERELKFETDLVFEKVYFIFPKLLLFFEKQKTGSGIFVFTTFTAPGQSEKSK